MKIGELARRTGVSIRTLHYYTKEQLEELKQRADALGEKGMRQAQQDWADLIEEVRIEMEKGTDPTSPQVVALGRRWPVVEVSLSRRERVARRAG